jgi:putative oxidoreductase
MGGGHVNGSGFVSRWRSLAPYLLSVLRIVTAFLFMQVGTAKLFAFPAAVMPGGGTAPVASLAGVAGVLEAFGGVFVLAGLFTRPVAFLLSGEMAVAYFYAHAPQGFWPVLNQGAPAALYAFLFLYLSAAGAGPWSLDALRSPTASRALDRS